MKWLKNLFKSKVIDFTKPSKEEEMNSLKKDGFYMDQSTIKEESYPVWTKYIQDSNGDLIDVRTKDCPIIPEDRS
jgi:hypothetical protein